MSARDRTYTAALNTLKGLLWTTLVLSGAALGARWHRWASFSGAILQIHRCAEGTEQVPLDDVAQS
jgi:hypothetical protein